MNKKIANPFVVLLLLIAMFWGASCKKADIKFGQEFLDNDITQIFKVDSFGVDLSTVYLDSFITSAKGTVLLGSYKDPYFGTIKTNSYFELTPPAYSNTYIGTTLDSICLILKPNANFYGDSTMPVTITLSELQDSIYLPEGSYNFYNNVNFAAKPTPIISKDVVIRPKGDNQISLRLPNAFGNIFLNKLKDPTDKDLQTSAAFLRFFKGMKISCNGISTNMIVGCTDALVMRMYYKVNLGAQFPTNQTADFTLTNKAHQFNNISIDRTGTVLGSKNFGPTSPATRLISSTTTGNAAYTQAITGSMIKLTFPTIRNISQLPNYAKVLKATLIIKPVQGTYSTTFYLPPSLRLSATDANNLIGSDLVGLSNFGYTSQYGSLQVDYGLGQNTQYQYDLTQYVKAVLETSFITPGDGLLLTPPSPSFETQFARVVVGNKYNSNSNSRIQLLIYYAAVK